MAPTDQHPDRLPGISIVATISVLDGHISIHSLWRKRSHVLIYGWCIYYCAYYLPLVVCAYYLPLVPYTT
jgi:hypothetical protein